METHIVPVGFDYDRLIASLAPLGLRRTHMAEDKLEPITPDNAVLLYLNDRRTQLADETIDSYRHKLTRFIEWRESEETGNINDSQVGIFWSLSSTARMTSTPHH